MPNYRLDQHLGELKKLLETYQDLRQARDESGRDTEDADKIIEALQTACNNAEFCWADMEEDSPAAEPPPIPEAMSPDPESSDYDPRLFHEPPAPEPKSRPWAQPPETKKAPEPKVRAKPEPPVQMPDRPRRRPPEMKGGFR